MWKIEKFFTFFLHVSFYCCIFVMETNNNTMEHSITKKICLCTALDTVTKEWVMTKDLFAGGCAYATGILARQLEKAGIRYEVVAYTNDKEDIIVNSRSCAHMGIRVDIDGRKIYIGGDFKSIYPYEFHWRLRVMKKMTSDEILDYYKKVWKYEGWNDWYNVRCNGAFSRRCNEVYNAVEKLYAE